MICPSMCGLRQIFLAAVIAAAAHADEPRVVGAWRFDPSRFGPTVAWLMPLIGVVDAAGLIPLEDQPVADGLLVGSLLGTYPHRATLWTTPENGGFRTVVEADAPGQFPVMRQALQTILTHYGDAANHEQELFDLPGDRQAVRYRLADWPEHQYLEWFADAEHFYIGVGRGALATPPSGASPAAHRAAIRPLDGADVFLELYVDVAALHETMGADREETKLARHWRLSRFGGAQQMMLHGRWAGTSLVLDISMLRDGQMTATAVTLDRWPAQALHAKPPGSFHIAAPIDWPATVERIGRWADAEWDEPTRQRCAALGEKFAPLVLISDYPRPFLPLPGTATTYAAVRDDADPERVAKQLHDLVAPFMQAEAGDVKVAHDRKTGLYWLDSPLRKLIKAPAWGWSNDGRVLIVSFSPQAVLENRRWLANKSATSSPATPLQ